MKPVKTKYHEPAIGEPFESMDSHRASLYAEEVQMLGVKVRQVVIDKFDVDLGIEKSTDIAQIIIEDRS